MPDNFPAPVNVKDWDALLHEFKDITCAGAFRQKIKYAQNDSPHTTRNFFSSSSGLVDSRKFFSQDLHSGTIKTELPSVSAAIASKSFQTRAARSFSSRQNLFEKSSSWWHNAKSRPAMKSQENEAGT